MGHKNNNSVSVLIPAHNEEEIIVETLSSIFTQTLKPKEVVIICDNCTDNTVPLIKAFIKTTKEKITIFETSNNVGKKAGALNQAFNKLNLNNFVLVMDADTSLDIKALESGVHMLNKESDLGAVCSRAGIMNYNGKSLWKKLIWTLQHIEYGQFDSHRIETKGKIKVAHGMATLFRLEALKSIPDFRKKIFNIDSDIYLEDNLVEDYEITLCLKHNWKLSSCMDMLAWTDVPLSLKELWVQRLRWLRGGVDTLRSHSWNQVTVFEILNHWLFILLVFLRGMAAVFFVYYMKNFGFQGFDPFVVSVILFAYFDSFYRLRYVQNKTLSDYIIKLLILPELLYGWFQALALLWSYILSFFKIKQRW
ncbi:cellulose synthase/poly-beta-1,6-N-acetylglucosamine synthase-like glycosyltransferase [Natranaerovirga pectinivora]|uniref:Cellulose synthase/poly-beta-1,6-N-acetylglucosamine synthase-like glycosyltransferase n=1 Tax=Natranaerovirga pectinivora TaxID=682400 RepID=A0A4R3MHZ7_9FIRM|nr:glycosyltransferase family 2 protein [Natranaerovirga pectinivora]TCT12876.1 cellulose synthase/poly-beta-1,6-N-acetylglucosamine synthase-like glycosyltransferase [Natranaerovirga pectinivora]